ncbi:xanthine dehydrogenase family protein subunit M [Massilia sp. Dwa41.01b]|uniref:FAD binding domain-containing protein n=1 Tax=unclassified Massilia TaxID=2609279 RepID=UPI0015FFC21B|nr:MULTISPECIES: xanthine dehydrogenase family protein subunit M [unclassified Massilia]QNA87454.1 xanthine dehydrogenase family protein subunit M [Massilia sp. Dwa41.01b]QNA98360.1 xanthine dehydrogenase family protein subunit M [Massilia sp. Se16.2.3]
MHSLSYERARDLAHAIELGSEPGSKYIGGGTNLLDLYKSGIERPVRLVDVSRLALNGVEELTDGGLRIGAMASNTVAANHPLVRTRYRVLSEAILNGATAQLRNMATVGGNLLQRTRCYYFTDPAFEHCNKRVPGSGCAAIDGFNRIHAILGASPSCIATNPSDMAVALVALDARVRLAGPDGERVVPMADFHRLPGDQPQFDTVIAPGELITAIDLPPPFAAQSHYVKVRDRASYAFALVSVATVLDLQCDVVRDLRLVLGGVAHKPWRAVEAEDLLRGQPLSEDAIARAGAAAVAGAQPYVHNAFKVELVPRAIARALRIAGGRA